MIQISEPSVRLLRSLVDQFNRLAIDIRDALEAGDMMAVEKMFHEQDTLARSTLYSVSGILQAHDA